MTVVGAVLRYSPAEPTFANSSRGQLPSTVPTSSLSAEDPALFILLPSHHVWAPHTRQRAVFSASSRSRASTTVVVEHHCPDGCRGHPSYVDGVDVPLLRKVQDIPYPERLRTSSWQEFTDRSSRILPRRLSRLVQRTSHEAPDTTPTPTPMLEQTPDPYARRETQPPTYEKQRRTLVWKGRRKDGRGTYSV